MKAIRTLLIFVVVLAIAGVVYVHSGLYDVAANGGRGGFLEAIAHRVSDNSVEHHAQGIPVPPLGDPAQLKTGFAHYQEMCITCHGAPGVKASEIGAGLNPHPPNLIRSTMDMPPNEVYWVTKNGIKMTGMPAFGPTHNESELWAITAFVKQLPTMTPEQYQAMVKAAGAAGEHHEEGEEHEHPAMPPTSPASGPGH
ncbi:MAG TPA: cytochrome c [Thermoanaerobaculia bacterium]|nr:cytochrome c [Thermoanaerobaculia bacterium]